MKNLKQQIKKEIDRSICFTLSFLTILSLMPVMAWQSLAEELGTVGEKFPLTSQQKNLPSTSLHFTDVPEETWYYDYVKYAYENGLFSGATATTFDPEGSMVRGMFVTVLGNGLAQVDKSNYQNTTNFQVFRRQNTFGKQRCAYRICHTLCQSGEYPNCHYNLCYGEWWG